MYHMSIAWFSFILGVFMCITCLLRGFHLYYGVFMCTKGLCVLCDVYVYCVVCMCVTFLTCVTLVVWLLDLFCR